MARLEIVVTADCPGCQEASRLAGEAQRRYPDLAIDFIDIGADPDRQPANVFAVPTYLLDGQIISLGTPDEGDLFRRIEGRIDDDGGHSRQETAP